MRSTPYIMKKGGVLLGIKIAFAALIGIVAGRILGMAPIEGGFFAGLSVLAIVAALNDTNGGLYISLMGQYGRKKDAGAYSIMSLKSGPLLTMVTLGIAGLAAFPWQALVGAILPLALGMLVGNLDPKMRALLAPAVPAMVPFLGLELGLTINLTSVVDAGLLGILLGLFVVLGGGLVLFIADKISGGDGVSGPAAATTAGNAALVPPSLPRPTPSTLLPRRPPPSSSPPPPSSPQFCAPSSRPPGHGASTGTHRAHPPRTPPDETLPPMPVPHPPRQHHALPPT